jgi:hypothetical protein
MLANQSSTPDIMRKALIRTITALDVAARLGRSLSEPDRARLAAEKERLLAALARLNAAVGALEAHDLGPGLTSKAQVEMGDVILVEEVRAASGKTRIALRDQDGLGSAHAFGKYLNELVQAPLAEKPGRVVAAAARLLALPEFPGRAAIKAGLEERAEQQWRLLDERQAGALARDGLSSEIGAALLEAANALIRTRAALADRFPQRREYVASFFLDVGYSKKKKDKRLPAIIAMLKARGVAVKEEARKTILGAKDEAVIARWVLRSVTAASTDELFAP